MLHYCGVTLVMSQYICKSPMHEEYVSNTLFLCICYEICDFQINTKPQQLNILTETNIPLANDFVTFLAK